MYVPATTRECLHVVSKDRKIRAKRNEWLERLGRGCRRSEDFDRPRSYHRIRPEELLEDAQDSLDEEADSIEGSVDQLAGAARAIAAALTSGVQTITEIVRVDPELADALQESSTCQQLREETT